MLIEYKRNSAKIIEGLVWIANSCPGIDHYHVVKTCFVADKLHLNKYGRPVFGDIYIAMEYGPVPSYVLDVINTNKRNVSDDEMNKINLSIQILSDNKRKLIYPKKIADANYFSGTELECLNAALTMVRNMTLDELKVMTHKEKSWNNAWNKRRKSGQMSELMYVEDIIDEDNENKEYIMEYIKDTFPNIVL